MGEIFITLSFLSLGLERLVNNYPVWVTGALCVITGILLLIGI